MRKLALLLFLAAAASAQTGGPWTIAPDPEHGSFTISHTTLGVVMRHVRLNLRHGNRLERLAQWTPASGPARSFTVHTSQPRTSWQFEFSGDTLRISSTLADAAITGEAPAGLGRIPARLIDPQGAPVDWVGTQEVMGTYHGTETHNQSYLPRRNPEVMYFTLGKVASPVFHGLFDRQTDTGIQFSDQTTFQRNEQNPDLLDVTMPVPGAALLRVIPDYFTKTLGLPFYKPFDDSYFSRAPMVWSSWTSYYEAVREEDIVRNTDWLAANLKPYGFEYVQLDDGYDRGPQGEHWWIENWDTKKFPHGPKWLADYIRGKGLRAGIWIVPNAYAGFVDKHPEWYVYDKDGKIIHDYSTAALDSSRPDVMKFVEHMFETLDSWGYDYYKFDGEHALPQYVPALDHSRLYDSKTDPVEVYRRRLERIRAVLGPQRFIEGCPAGTPLNGVGYFNSAFTGHDLYNNWQGMYPLFSSINANAFLNHLAVYVMPGEGLELGLPMTVEETMKKRPPIVVETARTRETPLTGFGLNAAEARTLVTYVALTGVAYPLASVMPELPAERVKLLKATMPTMPILPADLYSRGTDMLWDTFKHTEADFYVHNYPEVLDLKVDAPSGQYDVVGLTNWRSGKDARDLDLAEKLGLDPGARYLVMDFWNQRLLEPAQNHLRVDVPAHDTRVLLVRRSLDRPQLLGTSRHITGAYSISKVAWKDNQLSGASETVAGEPYALWIHLPHGKAPSAVHVTAAGGAEVKSEQKVSGELLTVTFSGQKQPVEWRLAF